MYERLSSNDLILMAVTHGEAIQLSNGSISCESAPNTGRSPDAKYYVRDLETEKKIDWLRNKSISPEKFQQKLNEYKLYMTDNFGTFHFQSVAAVRDKRRQYQIDIFCEFAKHALFVRNMFIPNFLEEDVIDKYTVYHFPSLTNTPEVIISISDRTILISGTKYAGEIKKSVFSVLNYHFPEVGDLPMHCSVNVDKEKKNPAIFFGLSGTGKTTLSSDNNRILIGDDEHCWTDSGLTNFEGGCYAKTINLTEKSEPQIYKASTKKYAMLENVAVKDNFPNFFDSKLTENGRASYPSTNIEEADLDGYVDLHPKNIIMLTCDAFGVLPAVCALSPSDAVSQFRIGYTAKIAGTEKGISKPVATFSPCFGGPFMPLPVQVYADILEAKITKYECQCWLVNTGWSDGPYGVGKRIPLEITRLIIDKILDGTLSRCNKLSHIHTGFCVPDYKGIDEKYLKPELGWSSQEEYQNKLMELLHDLKSEFWE